MVEFHATEDGSGSDQRNWTLGAARTGSSLRQERVRRQGGGPYTANIDFVQETRRILDSIPNISRLPVKKLADHIDDESKSCE